MYKRHFLWGLFLRILVQHQLLKFHILYSFLLEISLALSRKKRCYFSHGPPFTLCFQCLVCPKPCFLILICYYPNFMSKTDFFKNVLCLWCTLQIVFVSISIRCSESCLFILIRHKIPCLKLIYKLNLLPEQKQRLASFTLRAKFEHFSISSFAVFKFQEFNFDNAKEYQRYIQDIVIHLRWSLWKVR